MSRLLRLLLEDLLRAILPPIGVLALFFLRILVWPRLGALDVVAHFLGGLSIAWMTLILWKRWTKHGWIPKTVPTWLRDYAVWGTVALVGIVWEFMETIMTVYVGIRMQLSIPETMGDLFMDLSGGFVFLAMIHFKKK